MSLASNYRIGDFRVNLRSNELFDMKNEKAAKAIKVEPRVMKVLEILIRNSPDLVTRQELIEEVWDNYGGAEDALNQAVSQLRKILNDKDKKNRIIETIPKKGYRLNRIEEVKKKGNHNIILYAIFSFLIILLLILLIKNRSPGPVPAPEAPQNTSQQENNMNHKRPR